jgi:hypothetical protein
MKSNALIIFDWDDTLFPTSWFMEKGLKLNELSDISRFIVYFQELDNAVYKLLKMSLTLGIVVIVTNANMSWIRMSKKILVKTSTLIDENINIISARDNYIGVSNVSDWKVNTFKNDIAVYIHDSDQIISIGDAKYEYDALVALRDHVPKSKFLKTIKFVGTPTFNMIMDQIDVAEKSLGDILECRSCMDLRFNVI